MSACDEEPCKSLIDDYWAKTIIASEAELVLRLHCDVWKAARRDYWMLFSIWLAVFAHAVACAALHWPPVACAALTWASFLLLSALIVWGIRILGLRRLVRVHEAICRRLYSEMLSIRRAIAVQCPRECQPQAVKIECGC
ncbi:MAG: hypothetical protein JWN66_3130 [Sphingomonas bacterium]|uniref:hypothetical protein n=1 Tax=Sphingomonas bacterium TaxID=1895847 RepID=UPI0026239A99|nr:hypothetical protein [Sphingomonas bacterium]MDB5706014.1 hypothetical protein [Sphingomonas bacterium]